MNLFRFVNKLVFTALVFVLGAAAVAHAQTQTVYVSNQPGAIMPETGQPANYSSIQAALDAAQPGTQIKVFTGVYNERVIWRNSGTPGNKISLNAYYGQVFIDGSQSPIDPAMNSRSSLLEIQNVSHIELNYIRVRNNYRQHAKGIYINGSGTDITLQNCFVFNIGWTTNASAIPQSGNNANPLLVVGSKQNPITNLTIGNTRVYDCLTGNSEGLTVTGNVDNFLIYNCEVHHISNIGIDIAGHYSWTGAPAAVNFARNGRVQDNTVYECKHPTSANAGIYVDGASNIIVQRNKSYNNTIGFSLGCEVTSKVASNLVLRDNMAWFNAKQALVLGSGSWNSKVANSEVYNNTFFENYGETPDATGLNGAEVSVQNAENISIRQNIFVPRQNSIALGKWGYTASNFTLGYNLYWRNSGNANARYLVSIPNYVSDHFEPAGLIENPQFNNITHTSLDLHIAIGSPARNAGVPGFTAHDQSDIDRESRIKFGRIDIGADEIQ